MSKALKTLREIELDLVVKSGLIQQLKHKNNQLQQRIDNAIAYIKEMQKQDDLYFYKLIDLLDILEGKENEN